MENGECRSVAETLNFVKQYFRGELKVENGEWRIESGKWNLECGMWVLDGVLDAGSRETEDGN